MVYRARFQFDDRRDCVMLIKGGCLVKEQRSHRGITGLSAPFFISEFAWYHTEQNAGNHAENHTRVLGEPNGSLAIIICRGTMLKTEVLL